MKTIPLNFASVVWLLAILSTLACKKSNPADDGPPKLMFLGVNKQDVTMGDYLDFQLKLEGNVSNLKDTLFMEVQERNCGSTPLVFAFKQSLRERAITKRFAVFFFDDRRTPVWTLNLCPGVDAVMFRFFFKDNSGNVIGPVGPEEPVLVRNN